ncbi:MAG: murein hydrolase activator EnvC family protein [Muribaculaceae bacterium]
MLSVVAGGRARRSRQQVSSDRRTTEQQAQRTRQDLQRNQQQISQALDDYNSVRSAINLHNDTIATLRRSVDSVNREIRSLNDSIAALERSITALRANYGETLRNMRSRRQAMSDWAFIFSANSFGQAWRRYRYLQEVAQATTRRARRLRSECDRLAQVRTQLEALQQSLQQALTAQQRIQTALRAEEAQADALVRDLRRNQRALNQELQRRQRQINDLDNELNDIIAQEAAEAAERERREREERERREREERERREREERERQQAQQQRQQQQQPARQQQQQQQQQPARQQQQQQQAQQQPARQQQQTTQSTATSGSFEAAKGKLMAPLTGSYRIVAHFGVSSHAELSKVKVNNTGIDIEAQPGASARAVFDGEVTRMFVIEGYHNVVIVRHGKYLTVYAGLGSVSVTKGVKVKAGQTLGSIFVNTDDSNRTLLHFEVRNEFSTLNPEEWLK